MKHQSIVAKTTTAIVVTTQWPKYRSAYPTNKRSERSASTEPIIEERNQTNTKTIGNRKGDCT